MPRNIRKLNWNDFAIAVSRLEYRLAHSGAAENATGIYGVPRGGLVLAVALSHRLNVPLILQPQDGMIWVDDIVDTGHTVNQIQHMTVAKCCWVNRNKALLTDVSAYVMFDDDWVLFPWEQELNALVDMEAYECSR